MRAGADEDGGVFLPQLFDRLIGADAAVQDDPDASAPDELHLVREDVLGEAVGRDPPEEHAARAAGGLVDGHGEPSVGQVPGRRESRRSRTDDGDLRGVGRGGFLLGKRQFARFHHPDLLVHGEPFELPDGQGRIHVGTGAGALAGGGADPAADRGQGVSLPDEVRRLHVLLLLDQLDVPLDVDVGRTLHLARGMAQFQDPGLVGDRLGGIFLDDLPLPQVAVVAVVDLDRAGLGAVAAVVADLLVDVAGGLLDGGLEIPRRPFQLLEPGEGQDFDIEIAGALDELRGDDAGRAIAGGKGLVQMGHHPADGGRILDQIDLETGIGQVEGSLDAGDAPSLHQYGADFFLLTFFHDS